MNKKMIISLGFFTILTIGFIGISAIHSVKSSNRGASEAARSQYLNDLKAQNRYHFLIHEGDSLLSHKKFVLAEVKYLQAFRASEGTSLEGVTRGALMRLYEQMGEYDKALSQLDWLLAHMDKNVPQYEKFRNLKKDYIAKASAINVQK